MAKKTKKENKFLKKLMNPYRLVVVNEDTFEEQFQFGLSRLNLIVFLVLIFALFSTGIFFIISYSPLKEYIPGYDATDVRKQAVENLFLTDSLLRVNKRNAAYINIIRGVINDDLYFKENPEINLSNDVQSTENTFITRSISPEDSLLRNIVNREDKFNVINNLSLGKDLFLLAPAKGQVSQQFDKEEKHFAVDIALTEGAPIKAVANGTVIFAEYAAQTGYVIMVEHDRGMLSVYKHNAVLNKEQGDLVEAGEVIAQAGNTGEFSTGSHLHFELWIDGYPLDPELFFDFNQ